MVVDFVVAAAGYGKTTLLRHKHAGAVWVCGIDELPDAGPAVIDDLPRLSPEAARDLLARLERQPGDVAIATRYPLPVSTARLRGRGLLRLVRPAELALSADEAAELLENDYGVRDPDLADRMHEATAGWPALLRLMAEAASSPGDGMPEPQSPLWTFIEEEVLAPLPEHATRLLTDVADLEPLSAGLVQALGYDDAAAALDLLTSTGLVSGDRVVPVVAHVVRHGGAPSRTAMLAGLWYEEAGYPASALRAFAQAGNTAQCGRLLDLYGQEILAAGHARLVIDLLPKPVTRQQKLLLGDAIRTTGSALGAAQIYSAVAAEEPVWDAAIAWRMGMLHYHKGDSRAALAAFAKADDGIAGGPSRDRSLLLCWRASAHLQLGETATAVELAESACRDASAAGDDLALATAYVTLALCGSVSGLDADSNEVETAALELAEKVGSVFLRARILASRTLRLHGEAKYEEALEAARQNAQCAAVAGHPGLRSAAYGNQGEALLMIGRYDEAVRQFRRAEAIQRRIGSRRSAGIQLGLGEVYRRRGWVEQARAAYETALEMAEEAGLHQVEVNAMAGLARLLAAPHPGGTNAASTGASTAASTAASSAASTAASSAASTASPNAASTAASTGASTAAPTAEAGDTAGDPAGNAAGDTAGATDQQRAAAYADAALNRATDREVVAALLARGWVAYHQGDRATAAEMATDTAKRARSERDPAGLAESLELRAAAEADLGRARSALREAISVWTQAGAVAEAARLRFHLGHLTGAGTDDRLGALEAAETLARAGIAVEAQRPAAVVVKAFGRFEVWLEGRPVPPAQWQSRKARDLLRVLIARRGRPIPRDELCELLWPGEQPSGHRLSVLLSIIRRVLDPEKALSPDHYIVADQASIALDVPSLRVDVEEFLADVVHARRLRERGALDEAERLLSVSIGGYRADVFEDEPYEEWSVALREEARGGYVSALRMLAQICRKRGRTGAAVAHLLRLLSVDPYDEAGHRALIEALVAGGQHGEAKRARDRYREAMRAIGVKPA